MLGDHQAAPEALRATGTDNRTAKGAQQLAQQSERETRRSAAKGCERETEGNAQKKTPKPLQIADLGDDVRCTAKVAEEGLEVVLKFQGKTFILPVAGDSLGIFRPE